MAHSDVIEKMATLQIKEACADEYYWYICHLLINTVL